MRKKEFTASANLDWDTVDMIKESLEMVVDDLWNQMMYRGYEPLWQTFRIGSEEYSVDDRTIGDLGQQTVLRYNQVTAEVMGVKE